MWKAQSVRNQEALRSAAQNNLSKPLRDSVQGNDLEEMPEEDLQAELMSSLEERKVNNEGVKISKRD